MNATAQKASLLDRAIIGALLLLGSLLLGIQIAKAASAENDSTALYAETRLR